MFLLKDIFTCVVEALNIMPTNEQKPRPAATDIATKTTPKKPTAPSDFEQSLILSNDKKA